MLIYWVDLQVACLFHPRSLTGESHWRHSSLQPTRFMSEAKSYSEKEMPERSSEEKPFMDDLNAMPAAEKYNLRATALPKANGSKWAPVRPSCNKLNYQDSWVSWIECVPHDSSRILYCRLLPVNFDFIKLEKAILLMTPSSLTTGSEPIFVPRQQCQAGSIATHVQPSTWVCREAGCCQVGLSTCTYRLNSTIRCWLVVELWVPISYCWIVCNQHSSRLESRLWFQSIHSSVCCFLRHVLEAYWSIICWEFRISRRL